MIKLLKNKKFKLHSSGLWVSQDGEVYIPQSGVHPAHFTYGRDDCNGYLRVMYKRKHYLVHRLVAQCWIPNPDPKKLKTVDHNNRDKTLNHVSNLCWASSSMQNKNRGKYKKPNHPKNTAQSKKVYQYTLSGELVNVWPSTQECGRNGFDQSAVAKCCNGKTKTYKGFIWSYEPLFNF